MITKSRKLLIIIIATLCLIAGFAYVFNNCNSFCDSDNITKGSNSDIAISTEQILHEEFGYSDDYIARFKSITAETDIQLDKFLLGKEYAETPYTAEEIAEIIRVLKILVAQQFSVVHAVEKPTYTASAGAPGSGKTFALEKMFGINVSKNKFPENAIYIGPDSVVLSQMPTHLAAYNTVGQTEAYTKWRDASNYIANFMFIKAITDNLNIIHDTTSTSPKVKNILDALGKLGYTRNIHFYMADRDQREQALIKRSETGASYVTVEDALKKAVAAYEKLAYNTYYDSVESLVLYVQRGKFWQGEGETIAFAAYNPAHQSNIEISVAGQQQVDYLLKQIDTTENLKPELQTAIHKAVASWSKASDDTN